MKFKPLVLAMVAAVCSTCTPCYAVEPQSPTSLLTENSKTVTKLPVTEALLTPVVNQSEPTPGEPFSLSGRYAFARKEWSLVGAYTFDTLWADIGGKKGFNIELYGIGGGNANAGILGGGVGIIYPIHPRVSFTAGIDVVKRAETFQEFFADLKNIELGGKIGVQYMVPFRS